MIKYINLENNQITDKNLTIIIKDRIYNGIYSKGTIFSNINEFTLHDNNITLHTSFTFCINEKITNKNAKLDLTLPIIMEKQEIMNLIELIKKIISNPDYVYNESHYKKIGFDHNYYNYCSITINGIDYEINRNDEILEKIKYAIHANITNNSLYEAYNNLIH